MTGHPPPPPPPPPPGQGGLPPPPHHGSQPPYQQYPPPNKERDSTRSLLIALGAFVGFVVMLATVVAIVREDEDVTRDVVVEEGDEDEDVARDDATEEGVDAINEEDGDANGDDESDTRNLDLYPERADRQSDDHEAELGQSVRLVGYTVSVDEATMSDDGLGGTELIISVSIENRDDTAQRYSPRDWRIQTEEGQVLDRTYTNRDDALGRGDLVGGGTTTGTVAFDVGPGTYYVIYKPDRFSTHRGIWRIEV